MNIAIFAFMVGIVFGIVLDTIMEGSKKQAYLYAFKEDGSLAKVNLLDLKLTLCDNLKTSNNNKE